jgi:hypothetical protein
VCAIFSVISLEFVGSPYFFATSFWNVSQAIVTIVFSSGIICSF